MDHSSISSLTRSELIGLANMVGEDRIDGDPLGNSLPTQTDEENDPAHPMNWPDDMTEEERQQREEEWDRIQERRAREHHLNEMRQMMEQILSERNAQPHLVPQSCQASCESREHAAPSTLQYIPRPAVADQSSS